MALVLGYLLVWQRGLYVDDYTFRNQAIDYATGLWHTPSVELWLSNYPIRLLSTSAQTVLAGLIVRHEFVARLAAALGAGLAALLLGYLANRLLGSRLAGLVAGWLFLMPFYAQEAVLWPAASGYVMATVATLFALHALWTAISRPRSTAWWYLVGSACLSLALLSLEATISAFALVPALGVIALLQSEVADRVAVVRRAACATGCAALTIGAFYLLAYRRDPWQVTSRGGIDSDPASVFAHARRLLDSLWLLVFSDWSRRVTGDALGLGIDVVLHSWKGMLLAVVAGVLLAITALRWRPTEGARGRRPGVGVATVGLGILWSWLALFFPTVLVRGQSLEFRLLYFPGAGLAMAAAAAAWLLTQRLPHLRYQRGTLLLVGAVLLASSVCMVGYGRAFAARSELDRVEIASLVAAVPGDLLPPDTYLIMPPSSGRLFDGADAISGRLIGVFETPWSARSALEVAYRRDDFQVVAGNRWDPMRFACAAAQGAICAELFVGSGQKRRIPAERSLLLIERGGRILPVESARLVGPDGAAVSARFPIARLLRARGLGTIPELVLSGS